MTKRNLVEIILKIWGIYLLVSFIMGVFQLFYYQYFHQTQGETSGWVISSILTTISVYMVFTLLFLFHASWIAKFIVKEDGEIFKNDVLSGYNRLSFWIAVIGLFYFIPSVKEFLYPVIRFFAAQYYVKEIQYQYYQNFQKLKYTDFIKPSVQLIISLFFIFKSQVISDFIQKKKISKKSEEAPDTEK